MKEMLLTNYNIKEYKKQLIKTINIDKALLESLNPESEEAKGATEEIEQLESELDVKPIDKKDTNNLAVTLQEVKNLFNSNESLSITGDIGNRIDQVTHICKSGTEYYATLYYYNMLNKNSEDLTNILTKILTKYTEQNKNQESLSTQTYMEVVATRKLLNMLKTYQSKVKIIGGFKTNKSEAKDKRIPKPLRPRIHHPLGQQIIHIHRQIKKYIAMYSPTREMSRDELIVDINNLLRVQDYVKIAFHEAEDYVENNKADEKDKEVLSKAMLLSTSLDTLINELNSRLREVQKEWSQETKT